MKVKSLSRVQLFVTPWTAAHRAPPSMGFSRQEYWSGVPLPSPIGPVSMINIFSLSRESKSKQSKHRDKNIFWILRHFLLRNQIFSLISKGFYLSPSREIISSTRRVRCLLEIFKAAMACTGISSSWGFCCFISSLNAGGPLRLNLLKRKSYEFVGSIWRNRSISLSL